MSSVMKDNFPSKICSSQLKVLLHAFTTDMTQTTFRSSYLTKNLRRKLKELNANFHDLYDYKNMANQWTRQGNAQTQRIETF